MYLLHDTINDDNVVVIIDAIQPSADNGQCVLCVPV